MKVGFIIELIIIQLYQLLIKFTDFFSAKSRSRIFRQEGYYLGCIFALLVRCSS